MGEEILWKDRLVGFDYEVTQYDWLCVVIEYKNRKRHAFHNDPIGLMDFMSQHDFIYAGYNNKGYDNYITKGIFNHYDNAEIKAINDYIIGGEAGWSYPFDDPYVRIPPSTDLMLDLPLKQSLKQLEGNMCMDIRESTVSFDIDHPWTKEEYDEMLYYCTHDVEAVLRLIDERMSYLEAKVFNGTSAGLTIEESLYKTNAQLAAVMLKARKKEWTDERDIKIPDNIKFDKIPNEVIQFFGQTTDESIPSDVLFKKKLVIDMLGMEWTFAWGGVHASKQNFILKPIPGKLFLILDVISLYPSLMIVFGLLSRNVEDPDIFVNMVDSRVSAKNRGDKKVANALKVPINTVYGASLQEFNDLYDPRNGRSVCVTGQLLLTELTVDLVEDVPSFEPFNVNTDGIAFMIDEADYEKVKEVVAEWEKRTGLKMEEDAIHSMYMKDINNYIMVKGFDDIGEPMLKVKGSYVSDYPTGDYTHNSMSIVCEAIVNYFVKDTPVEETINGCDDPFRFQLIAKTGSTYDKTIHIVDGKEIDVQNCNRIYAVKDERYGQVKKWKKQYLELDEDGERRYYINKKGDRSYKKKWLTDDKGDYFIRKDTHQNCPDHAIIDNSCQITIDTIDKTWYISLAKKRINDYLGIKEEKKMPAARKTAEPVLEPRPALFKKIFALGEYLAKQKYIPDGYNDAQGYEYVKSSYYRRVLGEGCRQVGLVFKFNIANRIFTPLERTKNMNLTTILGSICLIDPDTGEHEDYTVMGDGSDNLDKGIYKAETMMIKYFVMNNFLLPETQDEEDPEDGSDEKKVAKENKKVVSVSDSKPTPPPTKEERKEIAQEVVSNDQVEPAFVEQMMNLIKAVQEKKEGYGAKTLAKLQKVLDGKVTLDKVTAVGMMSKIEDAADEVGVEV